MLNDSEVWDELNFDDRETSYYDEKVAIGLKAANSLKMATPSSLIRDRRLFTLRVRLHKKVI